MAVTGLKPTKEVNSLAPAPEAWYKNQVLIVPHATVRGIKSIDPYTDIEVLFGVGALADELKAAQDHSGGNLIAYAICVDPAEITAANIPALLDRIVEDEIDAGTVGFIVDCDQTLASAIALEAQAQADKKNDYRIICRYKKAYSSALAGKAATFAAGVATVAGLNAHGLVVDDDILIISEEKLNGSHTLTAVTADSVSFATIEADGNYTFLTEVEAETAGHDPATIQHHPDDYAMEAADEFSAVLSTRIEVVVPTTESNHLGIYMGQIAKCDPQESPAKRAKGYLTGATINTRYTPSHHVTLDSGRLVFLKRPNPKKPEIYVNDDNCLYGSQDKIQTGTQRLITNIIKQSIYHYGEPLVKDERFPPTKDGAFAAGVIAAQGLDDMKVEDGWIWAYSLQAAWNGENLEIAFDWTDLNRIATVSSSLKLIKAT